MDAKADVCVYALQGVPTRFVALFGTAALTQLLFISLVGLFRCLLSCTMAVAAPNTAYTRSSSIQQGI